MNAVTASGVVATAQSKAGTVQLVPGGGANYQQLHMQAQQAQAMQRYLAQQLQAGVPQAQLQAQIAAFKTQMNHIPQDIPAPNLQFSQQKSEHFKTTPSGDYHHPEQHDQHRELQDQVAAMQAQIAAMQESHSAATVAVPITHTSAFSSVNDGRTGTGTTLGAGVEYSPANDAVIAGMPDLSDYYPPMPTINHDSKFSPNAVNELDL